MKRSIIISIILLQIWQLKAQNFSFNFNTSGRRVCLVSSEVNAANNQVKILFLDSLSNTSEPLFVYRRELGTTAWTTVASSLPAGTGHWIDNNVSQGQIWEYQIKRTNTWNYNGLSYDATGYTIGSLLSDNTNYKGQMILLVANDIPISLAIKYKRLKKEITADGWFVNELIVTKASNWNSGNEVVSIKNQITSIYNSAPSSDKPKLLFILGHVPLPRSGSTNVIAPDDHNENKGARGSDAYYADINGTYTDTATYNPVGLATPLALNLPGDFKWDQDFFPSSIELAFGRVDFADITDVSFSETQMIENYLDRLSAYRNVLPNHDMGNKSAFYYGYDNSNDGSFRSLPNISQPNLVYQNYTGPNHNQWVQNNGSFKIYMQNLSVPEISDWQTYGMNATVYASDQSYWGFGDVPQPAGVYSRIRALLGVNSKCLVTLWTTTGINIFHQACTGQPFGLAMKGIMNHNQSNQYLEKPPQDYDTQEWWNRAHFAFYGDPTINLYQIKPATNLTLTAINGNAQLSWISSIDTNVMGYHVYESNSEFGVYNRITTSVVTGNSYTLSSYQNGNWYIVKAVKVIESGCGKFLHSSIGESIQGSISAYMEVKNCIQISPNIFEYDMYLTNTSPTTVGLRGYSWGLNPNTAIAINSNTALTHTLVSRSPLLANFPVVNAQYSNFQIRANTNTAAVGLAVNLAPNSNILLGHMRVTYNLGSSFPVGFNTNAWNTSNPIQLVTSAGKTQCVATVIVSPPGTTHGIIGSANTTGPAGTYFTLSASICPLLLNCECGPPLISNYSQTACETYTWPINGITYTSSGIYTSNDSGMCCNNPYLTSSHTLDLTILNGSNFSETQTSNGSYTWVVNGLTYTQSGMYTATSTGANGCTNYHTLQLTIIPSFMVQFFNQGYYLPNAFMQAVLFNQGIETNPLSTLVDYFTIKLHATTPPYNIIDSFTGLLSTNGQLSCYFPQAILGNSYYLSIHHRNSIETWSATPVVLTSQGNYNFSNAATKAYGNNLIEVEPGIWAIYSGDINQDENLDLIDLSILEADINNFTFGYNASDINGDGNVDLLDAAPVETNVNGFVFSAHP